MPSRPLRVLFVVQGEGRGHMTQALALKALLNARGHTVCGALVGRTEGRKLPAFFTRGLGVQVTQFESPSFAYEGNAVSLSRTIRTSLRKGWIYAHHLQRINRQVEAHAPDVIVNFYEGLVGLYNLAFRPDVPTVCIGHQYMFHHPDYAFAPGQHGGRAALRGFTHLTAAGAARRLALSFYEAPSLPERRIRVVPPLLRRDVMDLDGSQDDGFLLVYLLNASMAASLETWHEKRRDVRIQCFWDQEARQPHPNLTFNPLCGERFLQLMARSRGVVCTAGFESVSEALWLGKPAYMVPTPGHLEQRTNALDADRMGAGMVGKRFNLEDFLHYIDRQAEGARAETQRAFRAWVRAGEARFVDEIERAAAGAEVAASDGGQGVREAA